MSCSEKRLRRWLGGKSALYFYVPIAVLLFGIALYAIGFYLDSARYIHKYDFENPVKAVYTDFRNALSHSRGYDLIYEYTAPDGTFYTGHSIYSYSYTEAQSYLGKEVDVFIDGKGDSTLRDYSKINREPYLITGIITLIFGTADVVIFVVPHRWKMQKKSERTS